MMFRRLAVSGAALLVGAFTVGVASPAYAQEEADLAVTFVGSTIAANVDEKVGTTEIRNLGPGTATGVVVTYDISALDTSKVSFTIEECAPPDGGIIVCGIESDQLAQDDRFVFFDPITVLPGATGSAGSITVSITHAGEDPDPSNDSATADVVISDRVDTDLTVLAPDVSGELVIDEESQSIQTVGDLLPGSETLVLVFVENQGSDAAVGVEVSVTLPEDVSFTVPEPECSHAVGDSSTTCQYSTVQLVPRSGTEGGPFCDTPDSCAVFIFPVKVAEDAPSPATLTGASAEAWDMELPIVEEFGTFSAPAESPTASLPTVPEGMLPDVDPTDNVSNFSFRIDGLDDSGSGGGDVGDDDGPLPVTGSPVLLISGLGAVLLVVGGALFLVARRRRVVPEVSDS